MQQSERPSGEQWTIRHDDHEVVVVEVGGGVRAYRHCGADVVAGYDENEQASGGRGQLLMPWPNRVRDGRYTFDGASMQLALSEPGRHNAIHGLVRWSLWSLIEQTASSLVVGLRLRPQQGWAWCLDLRVTYSLDDSGLTVTPQARNVGDRPAPFGFGAHPYLTVGEQRVDEVVLGVPASRWLETDPDRLLPVGLREVAGSALDYREPRPLREAQLDTAFTGLGADADGRWRVSLRRASDDRSTVLWADAAAYPWVQVFTGDTLPPAQRRTTGVAIEPMTCPPDALSSGDGLVVLEPGQEFAASWGIEPGGR